MIPRHSQSLSYKQQSLYKTEGREAAIAYYNDTASVNGQWYVFITDENDIAISHAVLPNLIGTDLKDIVGSDGYELGVDIAKATEDGRWIDYLWPNPETGKLELKRAWAIRHDGYLFGSGYYEPWRPDPATLPTVSKVDPEAFTVAFVHKAIARYEFDGIDATAAYYNAGLFSFRFRSWFSFTDVKGFAQYREHSSLLQRKNVHAYKVNM